VAGLLSYTYNANEDDIVIRKVTDTLKGARVEGLICNDSIIIDAVQVEYNELDSLYTYYFKDIDGSVSTYNVLIRDTGSGTYEQSVLLDTHIIANYDVEIYELDGEDAFKVGKLIEINPSKETQSQVTTYTNYLVQDGLLKTSILKILDKYDVCEFEESMQCAHEHTVL